MPVGIRFDLDRTAPPPPGRRRRMRGEQHRSPRSASAGKLLAPARPTGGHPRVGRESREGRREALGTGIVTRVVGSSAAPPLPVPPPSRLRPRPASRGGKILVLDDAGEPAPLPEPPADRPICAAAARACLDPFRAIRALLGLAKVGNPLGIDVDRCRPDRVPLPGDLG